MKEPKAANNLLAVFQFGFTIKICKTTTVKGPTHIDGFFSFSLIRHLLEQPDMSETKQNINLHRILTISFSFLVN